MLLFLSILSTASCTAQGAQVSVPQTRTSKNCIFSSVSVMYIRILGPNLDTHTVATIIIVNHLSRCEMVIFNTVIIRYMHHIPYANNNIVLLLVQ